MLSSACAHQQERQGFFDQLAEERLEPGTSLEYLVGVSSSVDQRDGRTSAPRSRRGSVAGTLAFGRRRESSSSGGASRPSTTTRTSLRGAFELASAPPRVVSSDEEDASEAQQDGTLPEFSPKSHFDEPRIVTSLVKAVAALPAEATGTLCALSLVSRAYRPAAQAALFSRVRIRSTDQLTRFENSLLVGNDALGSTVEHLVLHAREPSRRRREETLTSARRVLEALPNLVELDEDLFVGDWDLPDLASYVLSPTSACRGLRVFRSASAWWELGAVHELFVLEPRLELVDLGGAVVDREWASARLLGSRSFPALRLRQLRVAQVLHEDTLAVLLASTGGDHSQLESLNLGFQSIDKETPRESIVSAFRHVRVKLVHLRVHAPTDGGDDLVGFIDDILDELPALRSLEWEEESGACRTAMASSHVLERLPPSLCTLRAGSLVSLSTGKTVSALENAPTQLPPTLVDIDLNWAQGRGDERGREPWYRERHIPRIRAAAARRGIRSKLSKGG